MEKEELNQSKETYIYRIIPLKYFLTMIESRMLYLPCISQWDDPYELFLFKQMYTFSNADVGNLMCEAKRIYGQCWSLQRDNDAMWRIYSPDKMSVRIKTTTSLVKELEKQTGNGLLLKSAPINYQSRPNIDNYIKGMTTRTVLKNDTLLDSLFIKRNQFDHEKEYRLIAWFADVDENNNNNSCHTPDHVEIPIDPQQFILEVFLDPRLSDPVAKLLKHSISILMGSKCPVSQSPLYRIKTRTLPY